MVTLFTSVPLETDKNTVVDGIGYDCTLGGRTSLVVQKLMEALNVCLQSSLLRSMTSFVNRFLVVQWALLFL